MVAREHDVCAVGDLEPGSMRPVHVDGVEMVLVRDGDGEFHALRDSCSHMGAWLSDGRFQRRMNSHDGALSWEVAAEDLVVRCPWHSYEFDVRTGRCSADPERVRVRTYPVRTEDGRVRVVR